MKIQDIRNILPAALQQIFPVMNPLEILKKQILKKFRRTEEPGVLTGYTDSWRSARHFIGTVLKMPMPYI